MDVKMHSSWKPVLNEEFEKPYFNQLIEFVKSEYTTKVCYPKGSQIFSAFDHCHFYEVKVVIIGQDPYHGPNQANGCKDGFHNKRSTPLLSWQSIEYTGIRNQL